MIRRKTLKCVRKKITMNQQFDNFQVSDFAPQQSDAFFQMIDANRPRLEDYFAGTVSHTRTLEDTRSYCQGIAQRINERSYFPFIITPKEKHIFIGLVDVKNIDWRVPKAEIGYFIDQGYEGQGIISKALSAVIPHLIKHYQFKKLLCRANAQNVGSAKVALKNGFELEGTIRNDYRTTSGRIVDLNYYGRVF